MAEINGVKTATHTGDEKLVVHFRNGEVSRKRAIVVKRKTLAGGYWEGSRVYEGYAKNVKLFTVSVVDSGEGTDRFREWLALNNFNVTKYETE